MLGSFLILLSIVVAILLSEFTTRLFLYKVDYLQPYLYSDAKLGFVIKPYSAGHDKWGFRNKVFPDRVDIVALGDSMTYGNCALSSYSWPALLELKTNKKVYNMGVGGYGPVQYYYLLKEKALQLKPKIVIVGLYLGNDLWDTQDMIYNYQYWRDFRDNNLFSNTKQFNSDNSLLKSKNNEQNNKTDSIKSYLAHNSILYRIIVYSILGEIAMWDETTLKGKFNDKIVFIEDKKHNIKTSFISGENIFGLDINKKEIKEGLVKTLLLFDMMHQLCTQRNINFVVVVMPTKAMVYSNYIDYRLDKYGLIKKQIEYESKVTNEVTNHFKYNGINYVEVLPFMQNRIGAHMLYTASVDGHPNRWGYDVIAQAIAEYLNNLNLP